MAGMMIFGITKKGGAAKAMFDFEEFSIAISLIGVPTSIYGTVDLAHKVYQKWQMGRNKSVVFGSKASWTIVVPQYQGNYRRIEDTIASELIYAHCTRLGLLCKIQGDKMPISSKENIIVICGPKANSAFRNLYKGYKLELLDGEPSIQDNKWGTKYSSHLEDLSNRSDYAILARSVDPDTKRRCIFCAGIHGLGTIGAAQMLTQHKLSKYIKKDDNYESVVSVQAVDDHFSIGKLEFAIEPRKD